jgi:hypothetical protein
MSETPVNIKVRESRSESGQIFRVLALAPSRRIIGSVELLVPLELGTTLESRVGLDRQKEILALAEKLAGMVADAVENITPAEH